MSVVTRKLQTTQPQVPTGIDWSNPITAGLQGALLFRNGHVFDVAKNRIVYNNANLVGKFNRHGQAAQPTTPTSIQLDGYFQNTSTFSRVFIATPQVTANGAISDSSPDSSGSGAEIQISSSNIALNSAGSVNYVNFAISGAAPVCAAVICNSASRQVIVVDGVMGTARSGTTVFTAPSGTASLLGGNFTDDLYDQVITLHLDWNRVLTDAEAISITRNPWQVFAPARVIRSVSGTSGPVSHGTTGALTGAGSSIVGASAVISGASSDGWPIGGMVALGRLGASPAGAAVTHDTSGVLAGAGSTVAGSASRFRAFSTSGVLTGQGSTIAGAANRFRAMSAVGVLTGPGSAIAGSANRFRAMASTGALVGPGAIVVGAASRSGAPPIHDTTGAVTGAGAVIVGSSAHIALHGTSGALVGAGSVVAGSAQLKALHGSSGALTGQGATIAGAASRTSGIVTHDTSGALAGQGAVIAGIASNGDAAPANYYGGGSAKGAENYLVQKVNEKYAAIEKAQRLDAAIQPRNDVLDRAILEAKRRQSVENIKRRAFAKAKAHAETIAAAQDKKRQQSITLAETLKADAERRRSADELESARRKVQEASEAREAAQRAVVILGRDIATAQDAFRQSERAKAEAAKRTAAQALEEIRQSSRQAAKIRAELAKASEIPMPTSLQAQAIRAQAVEDDQIMTLMAMMLLED